MICVKEYVAGENDGGMRIDRFISKLLPHLPPSLIQRSIRQKKARLNGKHCGHDARLSAGDVVTLYLKPEQLAAPDPAAAYLLIDSPALNIVYEDKHILIVNKPVGLPSHDDDSGSPDTLIAHVQAYLYKSGAWTPESENAFRPSLCHRLDRNTSGLVMCAKTHTALVILSEKIREREIGKYYLCLADGILKPPSGVFTDYIFKHQGQSRVSVTAHPVKGAKTAVTRYRTLKVTGGVSLLECALETGRTHQIRAQLAFHGHPLTGDGKYGRGGGKYRLCAFKLIFDFKTHAGELEYLNGRTFEIESEFSKSPR